MALVQRLYAYIDETVEKHHERIVNSLNSGRPDGDSDARQTAGRVAALNEIRNEIKELMKEMMGGDH